MRILIAEDDEALARFVRQGLEGEHYTVDAFKDGEQSLSAALACDYEAVILDLNLPKLDGVARAAPTEDEKTQPADSDTDAAHAC